MSVHRMWLRRGLLACLVLLGAQQLWRHGHDYVLTREFAVVEPGRIYRGGWQKDWPMRRIIRDYHIKSLLALAHPEDHPLSVQERELAKELGIRWIHIPIVDLRSTEDPRTLGDLLDAAADAMADPANQPIFFHCHHGLNRASMAQIAYRTRHCGWTLEEATEEVARTVGLVKVTHGPDYRHMVDYYHNRVLPQREREKALSAAAADDDSRASSRTASTTPPETSARR